MVNAGRCLKSIFAYIVNYYLIYYYYSDFIEKEIETEWLGKLATTEGKILKLKNVCFVLLPPSLHIWILWLISSGIWSHNKNSLIMEEQCYNNIYLTKLNLSLQGPPNINVNSNPVCLFNVKALFYSFINIFLTLTF